MNIASVASRVLLGASALLLPLAAAAQTASTTPEKKAAEGSRYVQCDGEPNNVTGGETAARLLGAVTLLGLFAPPPEAADASKRKFGAEGVTVCSELLTGEKREGNPSRRVGLIMARAIHQIEAKDFASAIADADLAQKEAEAAGLMADPYFARSRGRAFDLIRAAALFRQGKIAEARDMTIRNAGLAKHSFLALSGNQYSQMVQTGTPAEAQYYGWMTRSTALLASSEAARLEEIGRLREAATLREAKLDFLSVLNDQKNSVALAEAAVANALAGNRELGQQRAREAQANFDQRRSEGKPETNAAEFVELIDLYHVIDMADGGDIKGARRLFAARSQWIAPSFGMVVEVTRRLLAGASADERIGGLSRDPAQLWADRIATTKAALLDKDSDNKTLFYLVRNAVPASAYEALSKNVWNVKKSTIALTIKPKDGKPRKYDTFLQFGNFQAVFEGYLLHAALTAKSRGHQGFVLTAVPAGGMFGALVLTGNRGEPGLPAALYNDADEIIADLSSIIPSPDALKARRAAKS